jgi:hypothetical protein
MIHKSDNSIKFLTRDLDIRPIDIRTAYFEVHGHEINKDRFSKLYHMPDEWLIWKSYYAELQAISAAIEHARYQRIGVEYSESNLLELLP